MKKIVFLTAATLFFLACNKKMTPPASDPATTKTEETVKPEVKKMTQEEEANAAVVAQKNREDGMPNNPNEAAGKMIYETKCTKCHGKKQVDKFTMAQWEGILRSMVPKAKLTSDEETQLYDFIKTHAKVS